MSSASPTVPPPQKLTFTHWLILTLAAIGFAFDIYEILMAPLIVVDALRELGGIRPGTPEFSYWSSMLIYIPAIFGGIFGLIGGYLTDYMGRRRVLTGSILIYAVSAFCAGYSTSLEMLLVLRTTTFIGVCVEFVAAVAWLAELFPNPHQRETVLGYTQAFSSLGGLLVAVANNYITDHVGAFPGVQMPEFLQGVFGTIAQPDVPVNKIWRYTLMSGLLPAIPLILIRPFLPESPVWKQKKEAGTLKRPSIVGLFAPEFRRTTIVTTLMFACAYGAAFGAVQHIPQLVRGLEDVRAEAAKAPTPPEQGKLLQKAGSEYTKMQEIGGLTGRFLLAILAVRIISRRRLLRVFQLPGLIIVPTVFYFFLKVENVHFFTVDLTFLYLGKFPVTVVSLGAFLAGLFVVSQFSFWGNYLPRVYPVHLRGTGESFAANIGGRTLGVGFWGITQFMAQQVNQGSPQANLAFSAAMVAVFVFAAGSILCFFLPEPPAEMHD